MEGKNTQEQLLEAGQVVQTGEVQVIPYHRSLVKKGEHGGWVWNRPAYLEVKQGGTTKSIPIPNYTRLFQLGFLLASTAFMLITGLSILNRRRKQNE